MPLRITSGELTHGQYSAKTPTPVWAPHHSSISGAPRLRSHSEISELDGTIFIREDIGTLDVSMDHTLVVQIEQPFEHLGDVHGNQVFGELSEFL